MCWPHRGQRWHCRRCVDRYRRRRWTVGYTPPRLVTVPADASVCAISTPGRREIEGRRSGRIVRGIAQQQPHRGKLLSEHVATLVGATRLNQTREIGYRFRDALTERGSLLDPEVIGGRIHPGGRHERMEVR